MKILGSSENIIDVANKYGIDLSSFKDFLLKKCSKDVDYEKSFGGIVIDSVREEELVEEFSPGIANQKVDGNVKLLDGLYKIVPGPMLIDVGDGDIKDAFSKFSNIINKNAIDGWRYHSMEVLEIEQTNSGCLSTERHFYKRYMLIFEKTNSDGKDNK